MKHPLLPALVLLSGLCFATGAHAASRYVDASYGSNAGGNDCRDRHAPCQSINHALSQAQSNDRIIVAPGVYQPASILHFDNAKSGIKLTSVAGAAATVIDATSLGASYVFSIAFADKVVIGQKRRGFTIIADNSISNAILFINSSDRVRVEGNRLVGASGALNSVMEINASDSLTVRYNDMYPRGGSITKGLSVIALVGGSEKNRKWNISENRLSDMGECINIGSTAPNNANKFVKNRLDGCEVRGIYIRNYDSNLDLATASRDRYQDNLIRMKNTGIYRRAIQIDGGNPTINRNMVDVSAGHSDGLAVDNTVGTKITNNLLLGPVGASANGLLSYGVQTLPPSGGNPSLKMSGNTITGFNLGTAVDLEELVQFRNNNVLNISGCPLYLDPNVPARPLRASGNFWGDPSGPATAGCTFTQSLVDIGHLFFRPSARARPVKFRDPFN